MMRDRLKFAANETQACLKAAMSAFAPVPVVQGMEYAVQGGKAFRGFLVIESAALFGMTGRGPIVAGAAIEALHAYSLVHDDLPCMDDDDMRRGQPTVHKKWDDATAVLVGDALQTLAFDLLARDECANDANIRLSLISKLARAAGADGMVLGQAQDMAAETNPNLNLDDISELQRNKTGALIEWSACAGAVLAGEDPSPLRSYAQMLGLAFQIADDILDVEGDAKIVGKAVGKDQNAGKATFVSLLGLTAAKSKTKELAEQACDVLEGYGASAEILKQAAHYVVTRNK